MDDSINPRRKPMRLRNYDYSAAGLYFVTVCTDGGRCLFGEITADKMDLNMLGLIVADCWRAIPAHFPTVALDRFVVMPNHVHGIVQLHPIPQPQNGAMNRALRKMTSLL